MIPQLCRSWGRVRGIYLATSPVARESLLPSSILCRCETTSASAPAFEPPATPKPEKITAKVFYAPKYCSKEDIIRFFGCDLSLDDVHLIYDARFRPKYWVLELNSEEHFRQAWRRADNSFGGRTIKMERQRGSLPKMAEEKAQPGGAAGWTGVEDNIERRPVAFSGRSLMVQNLPDDVSTEQIEQFFNGYLLSDHPMRVYRFIHSNVRTPWVKKMKGEVKYTLPQAAELRALVRFESTLEARRAQRELHGQFCGSLPADLRFIH